MHKKVTKSNIKKVQQSDPQFKVRTRSKKTFKRWTIEQNRRYAGFLEMMVEKQKWCQLNEKKKKNQFYIEMAQVVGNKDNHQCRSHHIKMLRTHKDCASIIEYFLKAKEVQTEQAQNQLECEEISQISINVEEDNQEFETQRGQLKDPQLKELDNQSLGVKTDEYFPVFVPPQPQFI